MSQLCPFSSSAYSTELIWKFVSDTPIYTIVYLRWTETVPVDNASGCYHYLRKYSRVFDGRQTLHILKTTQDFGRI